MEFDLAIKTGRRWWQSHYGGHFDPDPHKKLVVGSARSFNKILKF